MSSRHKRNLRRRDDPKTTDHDAVLDLTDDIDEASNISSDNEDVATSIRSHKKARKEIEIEEIAEDGDPEEEEKEEEQESDVDIESSEDDYVPVGKSKKNNRRATKKHTSNSTSISKSKSHKNYKTPSNIDEIDDFVENPIFESLSTQDLAPSELAQMWIDDFTVDDMNKKFNALKDFLNFILRCSGCICQLSQHDVTNTDNAKNTIDEIQTLFERQQYHEFPLLYSIVGKNKDWKDFPDNALSFISQIIVIANESGILYEDNEEFVELILEWISAMSTSNARPLRYVSTIFGLTIQSVFCKISVNISKFIDKFLRQLKKENDSLKLLIENKKSSSKQLSRQIDSANERIKVIEDNVEMYKNQKKIVDSYIDDSFNTLFVHRYRDVSNEIRFQCVKYLGEWMDEYTEKFFDSTYLRYLGWLLTDQSPNIRTEVFKVLIKLYKKRVTVAALRQFTSYFKHKLIEIVIYEVDFNTRFNCLQLLIEIIEKGYLNEDEIIKITSLIFIDNEDLLYPINGSKLNPVKFLKEMAKFILKAENHQINDIIERDEMEFEEINSFLPFDCKTILHLKCLMNILSDSYEYYLQNYSALKIKNRECNSQTNKFSYILQYIYSLKQYSHNNENFEIFLNYVNFDFTAFKIPDEIKENLELDSKSQKNLLQLINAATMIFTEGSSNQFYKSLFPKNSENSNNDTKFYISKLITKLPELCYYFHDDITKISILINITTNLLGSALQEGDNNNTRGLVDTCSQFLRLFSVINFPLVDNKNNLDYDSISYRYMELFKKLPINELNLESQMDLLFKELTINLDNEIGQREDIYNERDTLDQNDDKIIELLNKFYIISYSKYTKLLVLEKMCDYIPLFMSSLYASMCNDRKYMKSNKVIKFNLTNNEILTFLNITDYYINESLQQIYNIKFKNSEDLSSMNKTKIFNSINYIQRGLSLIITNKISLNLNPGDLDLYHDFSINYLNNALSISAFKLEYLSNNVNNSDEDIMNLRGNISELTIHEIMKIYHIREFQVAEFEEIENDIERDEDEEVNFNNYSIKNVLKEKENEEDEDEDEGEGGESSRIAKDEKLKIKLKYETLLCELASKLAMICNKSLNLVNNENLISSRLLKNSKILGSLYIKILKSTGMLKTDEEHEGNENDNNKRKLIQSNLNSVIKKRKLIESDNENNQSDIGNEDENDPIENSDDNNEHDDENMEFSDIDDESSIASSNINKIVSNSEISTLASSFPFTQE